VTIKFSLLEKTAGIRIKHRDNTLIPSPPKLIGQRIFFRKEYILIQSLNYYSSVRIWVFPSLELDTLTAGLQGEVRYLKLTLEIPNTPHPKASSAYLY
jgi:hypothetical protein